MRKHKAAIKLRDVQGKKHPTDGLVDGHWLGCTVLIKQLSLTTDTDCSPQREKRSRKSFFGWSFYHSKPWARTEPEGIIQRFICLVSSPGKITIMFPKFSAEFLFFRHNLSCRKKPETNTWVWIHSIFFVQFSQETFGSVDFTELHLHDYCQARLKDALWNRRAIEEARQGPV